MSENVNHTMKRTNHTMKRTNCSIGRIFRYYFRFNAHNYCVVFCKFLNKFAFRLLEMRYAN